MRARAFTFAQLLCFVHWVLLYHQYMHNIKSNIHDCQCASESVSITRLLLKSASSNDHCCAKIEREEKKTCLVVKVTNLEADVYRLCGRAPFSTVHSTIIFFCWLLSSEIRVSCGCKQSYFKCFTFIFGRSIIVLKSVISSALKWFIVSKSIRFFNCWIHFVGASMVLIRSEV